MEIQKCAKLGLLGFDSNDNGFVSMPGDDDESRKQPHQNNKRRI